MEIDHTHNCKVCVKYSFNVRNYRDGDRENLWCCFQQVLGFPQEGNKNINHTNADTYTDANHKL